MKNKDIAILINIHFNPSPAEKAARALYGLGVRNIDVKTVCRTSPFPMEAHVLAVSNALRDLIRGGYVRAHLRTCRPKIVILTKKIAHNKTDSFFYVGKNIAQVSVGNRSYVLTTSGSYAFRMKAGGKVYSYDVGTAPSEAIRKLQKKITDKDTKAIGDEDLVSNWGWFGINVYENDHYLDSATNVWSEYDEAIKAFKEFVKANPPQIG